VDSGLTPAALRAALVAARNPDGGWGYYPQKATRLEPTAWALLALARAANKPVDVDAFLRWPQKDGWLIDGPPSAPANFAFNALAALTCLSGAQTPETTTFVKAIGAKVVAAKGIALQQSEVQRQDNSLQAWSWIDQTFSWVEPTAWCTLFLKKARPLAISGATERLDVAERLITDRVCHDGGWNYGGSNVYGQELYPYVPTTAIALLAMQDRRQNPAVVKSLAWLEGNVGTEPTAISLSLSAVCFSILGRPVAPAMKAMPAAVETSRIRANVLGLAMSLYAGSDGHHGQDAFKI
jgi:hypothetical protein